MNASGNSGPALTRIKGIGVIRASPSKRRHALRYSRILRSVHKRELVERRSRLSATESLLNNLGSTMKRAVLFLTADRKHIRKVVRNP